MAQTGYTPVSLYYSTTPAQQPLAANLVDGELALNITDGKLFYKNNLGVVQSISSDGGNPYSNVSEISGSTAAVKNTLYVLTASLTLTLPASPSVGDAIGVSNLSGTLTSVIGRNGNNIMGLAQDMTVDALDAGFNLVYTGASNGWVIL